MKIDRFVIVILLGLAACLEQVDTAAMTRSSELSAPPNTPHVGGDDCAISFCNENNPCPNCPGQSSTCGLDGVCAYGGGGGGGLGGGGGGGPSCPASLCVDASNCASNCPQSSNPQCVGGLCQY